MNDRPANDAVAIELRIPEGDGEKMTTVEKKLTAKTHKPKHWWNTIFIISCAFAVFNDPIFCYITAIDNKNKCFTMNKKLALKYVYARTATDVFYLLDFFISKCRCCCCRGMCCTGVSCTGKRLCKDCTSYATNLLSILSRIFVSLPIAQIYAAGEMNVQLDPFTRKFLFLTSLQYTLRIYYIYDSLKRRPIIDITPVERWVRPILGFVPFILASHLFGAFWYLLATRRQLRCWASTKHQIIADDHTFLGPIYTDYMCEKNPNETYYNGTKIWLWDELCPVNESNPKAFDFGIYFYALQSDVVGPSHHLLDKVFQSFWWALRNLSSFGSNLFSSMNTTEIFFSVMISATGMALFLVYLNAMVQESKERSNKRMLKEKKQLMKPEIDLWLSKYYLDLVSKKKYSLDLSKDKESKDKETAVINKKKENLKVVIMENIHKLKENCELDVQHILGILPIKHKQSIMSFLFSESLKKEPAVFQTINEKVLKAICQHLVPLTYTEDSYIFQEGKPLGKMLLFIQGTAVTYSHGETSSGFSSNKWLEKGDFYGDELLNWAFKSPSFSDLPISSTNVIAHEKVEAFAIRAKDLQRIYFKFWWVFSKKVNTPQLEQWEHLAAFSVQSAWRNRQARIHLPKPPTRWFRRRARTKRPTHWDRFVVN